MQVLCNLELEHTQATNKSFLLHKEIYRLCAFLQSAQNDSTENGHRADVVASTLSSLFDRVTLLQGTVQDVENRLKTQIREYDERKKCLQTTGRKLDNLVSHHAFLRNERDICVAQLRESDEMVSRARDGVAQQARKNEASRNVWEEVRKCTEDAARRVSFLAGALDESRDLGEMKCRLKEEEIEMRITKAVAQMKLFEEKKDILKADLAAADDSAQLISKRAARAQEASKIVDTKLQDVLERITQESCTLENWLNKLSTYSKESKVACRHQSDMQTSLKSAMKELKSTKAMHAEDLDAVSLYRRRAERTSMCAEDSRGRIAILNAHYKDLISAEATLDVFRRNVSNIGLKVLECRRVAMEREESISRKAADLLTIKTAQAKLCSSVGCTDQITEKHSSLMLLKRQELEKLQRALNCCRHQTASLKDEAKCLGEIFPSYFLDGADDFENPHDLKESLQRGMIRASLLRNERISKEIELIEQEYEEILNRTDFSQIQRELTCEIKKKNVMRAEMERLAKQMQSRPKTCIEDDSCPSTVVAQHLEACKISTEEPRVDESAPSEASSAPSSQACEDVDLFGDEW